MVKLQVARYPANEVLFFRASFSVVICLIVVVGTGRLCALRTSQLRSHLLRGSFHFVGLMSVFIAFRLMSLSDAVTITYSSPLFVTLLSIVVLNEVVGRHRWAAVMIGFIGVVIIAKPGAGIFQSGAMFALANALLVALVAIQVRRTAVKETAAATFFYQVSVVFVLSTISLAFAWITPTRDDVFMLCTLGVLSGIGQYCWMLALRFASAALISPFDYLGLPLAALFGFSIWGDIPTATTIAGAGLLVMSGGYIVYRESRRSGKQYGSLTPPSY